MDQDMQQYLDKAEVLIEALTYIQRFNRKIIVVKYGGSAMLDEELQKNVIKDVTFLKLVGFKPIIVHGGGKEISKWVSKAGMEPKFIDGLRVTDAETMEKMEALKKEEEEKKELLQTFKNKLHRNLGQQDHSCKKYSSHCISCEGVEQKYRYNKSNGSYQFGSWIQLMNHGICRIILSDRNISNHSEPLLSVKESSFP